MQISTKDWKKYINQMSKISQTAADKMQEWIARHGFGDDKALLDYAYALSTHYGEAIGALSCQMYEATAAAQKTIIKSAEAAATPEYGEVAKAVHGAKKQSEKLVSSAVGRLVKRVGADTTLKNAMRDGAQFAWVPQGDTCAFCLTLASRGWQYMSAKALKGGHAEHIHANCDCQYAVRFDSSSTVEGYDPAKYREMYDNAEGYSSQEKINSMRREIAAQKKAIANSKNIGIIKSGARFGAYTNENDPYGKKRAESAQNYYDELLNRDRSTEIKAVAKNTGFSEQDIDKVFSHVFELEHYFADGTVHKFDPDYYMQQSWMRLREGKRIQSHDLTLLKHELSEANIMKDSLEIIYENAHAQANKKYNYSAELMEYLKDHDA